MKGKIVLDEVDIIDIIRSHMKKEWDLQNEQISVYLVCSECKRRSEEGEIVAEIRRQW